MQADILLVEDSAAEARLAMEALQEAGSTARLHVVQDGQAALEYLRREGQYVEAPRPALVLLDLNLPRKDGREVLREIKLDAGLRQIPIVILTTSQAEADIVRAYELHANCYIQKPLELDRLIDIVKSIHSYWLQMAELPV